MTLGELLSFIFKWVRCIIPHNPTSPRIVKFNDGTYAIRKMGFFQYEYLDITDRTYWWNHSYDKYYKSSDLDKVTNIFNEKFGPKGANNDKGTPI